MPGTMTTTIMRMITTMTMITIMTMHMMIMLTTQKKLLGMADTLIMAM